MGEYTLRNPSASQTQSARGCLGRRSADRPGPLRQLLLRSVAAHDLQAAPEERHERRRAIVGRR